MKTFPLGIVVAFAVACVGLGACSDSTGSGGHATGGQAATGGNGAGAAGGSGTGGTAPSAGYCAIACTQAADCCQGNPMCPAGDYPNNPTCDGGFCSGAQCATDDDCTFGGTVAGYVCTEIDVGTIQFNACVAPCDTDADCTQSLTCMGVATDGTKYCYPNPVPCVSDADCNGYGKCDTPNGTCVCTDDAECTADGTACKQ